MHAAPASRETQKQRVRVLHSHSLIKPRKFIAYFFIIIAVSAPHMNGAFLCGLNGAHIHYGEEGKAEGRQAGSDRSSPSKGLRGGSKCILFFFFPQRAKAPSLPPSFLLSFFLWLEAGKLIFFENIWFEQS